MSACACETSALRDIVLDDANDQPSEHRRRQFFASGVSYHRYRVPSSGHGDRPASFECLPYMQWRFHSQCGIKLSVGASNSSARGRAAAINRSKDDDLQVELGS